jgi:hypothetical protein
LIPTTAVYSNAPTRDSCKSGEILVLMVVRKMQKCVGKFSKIFWFEKFDKRLVYNVQGNVEILKPNFPTKLIFYCTVFLLIIF